MSEHKSHAYNSNPFRTVMAQLVMLLSNNPISSLTLGLVMLVLVLGGFFIIGFIGGLIGGTAGAVVSVILSIAFTIVALLRFAAATFYLQIASREGRSISASKALSESAKRNYTQFVLTSLATAGLVLVGMVLLIIPSLFLIGRLSLAPYIAMAEGLGVKDALKRSWDLSNGHWFEVFAASIASMVVTPNGLLSVAGGQAGPAGRYYELVELKKSGAEAPETHWMNYLLTALAVLFVFVYALAIRNMRSTTSTSNDLCDMSTYRNTLLCDDSDPFRSNSRDKTLNDYIDEYNSSQAN